MHQNYLTSMANPLSNTANWFCSLQEATIMNSSDHNNTGIPDEEKHKQTNKS